MTIRSRGRKLAVITVTVALVGALAQLVFDSPSFASGPANGSQVPGSALPIGSFTAGTPFSSGQTIEVKIPANSNLQPNAKVNILECADSGGTVGNLPTDISQCDGTTLQGDTILVNADGSVLYTDYTVFALPDILSLGEQPNSTPVCNPSHECVLFIGEDQNNFTQAPYYFSQPFFVAITPGDSGASPGDGSGQKSQSITITSTPPSPALVGGSYTPTATGGASGNPVVFSIDSASSTGACSSSAGVVHFTGTGTCKVDANQAGDTAYGAAPTVTQTFTIGSSGPSITSANNKTATEGVFFSFSVTTSGTPAPKLKEKGKLPKGVKFHKGTGSATISGTANPKKNKTVGTYPIIITATFGKGKTKVLVTQSFTLQIND